MRVRISGSLNAFLTPRDLAFTSVLIKIAVWFTFMGPVGGLRLHRNVSGFLSSYFALLTAQKYLRERLAKYVYPLKLLLASYMIVHISPSQVIARCD